MKKLKFRYQFPTWLKIAIFCGILFWSAVFVYSCVRLSVWEDLVVGMKLYLILQGVFSLLFIGLLIGFLFTSYVFTSKNGKTQIGIKILFFDGFRHRVVAENVTDVILMQPENKLFISFAVPEQENQIVNINIAPKCYDEFYNAVKQCNPNVMYNIYEENDLDRKN